MVRTSAKQHDNSPISERRAGERHTLILRVGVLQQAGKVSLCLVKNISSKGVQLRLYSQAKADAPASIRVADELPVHGRLIWLRGDMAVMPSKKSSTINLSPRAGKTAP